MGLVRVGVLAAIAIVTTALVGVAAFARPLPAVALSAHPARHLRGAQTHLQPPAPATRARQPRPFALPRPPRCPHAALQAPDLAEGADERRAATRTGTQTHSQAPTPSETAGRRKRGSQGHSHSTRGRPGVRRERGRKS